jgi:hypothetical protein
LSDLLFSFLDYAGEQTGTVQRVLTSQDCYFHFEKFAATMLGGSMPLVRTFIPDIIRYETCLLRAGKFAQPSTSFDIDLSRIQDLLLVIGKNISIEEFTFNIPIITLDSKTGRFADSYPEEKTYLVFKLQAGQIDVKEINEFGVDFMRLCDGQRSLATIAQLLYPKYGEKTDCAQFADLCAEAARALVDLSWLLPGHPVNSEERGGDKDAAGQGSREKDSVRDQCSQLTRSN